MKAKISIKIIIFIISCSFVLKAQNAPGYVHLTCGKMYDGNDQAFYPLIMNYSVEYQFHNCTKAWSTPVCNEQESTCTSYSISPAAHYGPTQDYECGDDATCTVQIEKDMEKIKSMGFNMIRPAFTVHWDNTCDRLFIDGKGETSQGLTWEKHFLYLDPPYASDPDVIKYFQSLETVINIAGQKGLKSMLNGINGDMTRPVAIPAYLEFLQALGNYFKDNKNLAFYDILCEPLNQYRWAWNQQSDYDNYSKSEVCGLVTNFYDALKSADPNHLITGGNLGFEDALQFEPGAMKLDFSQPHFYGGFSRYDMSLDHYRERLQGQLWWFSKNCPTPWMAGEFGFRSTNDPALLQYNEGTVEDERALEHDMLNDAYYLGSMGFTYWEYQERSWPDPNAIPPMLGPSTGWGMVYQSADISDNLPHEKPVALEYQNFLDPLTGLPYSPYNVNHPPPLNYTATPTFPQAKPASYYDPHYTGQFNPGHVNAVSGSIVDQNGYPIEDAVVKGLSWLKLANDQQNSDPEDDLNDQSFLYTFTDADGYFELIPYNYVSPPNHRIIRIEGSAVGAEYFQRGDLTYPFGGAQMETDLGIIELNQVRKIATDNFISGKLIPLGQTENYRAKNLLTVVNSSVLGNISSGGNSELKAGCEVALLHDFSAYEGSEVQVFAESAVMNECSDYNSFSNARIAQSGYSTYEEKNDNTITLRFNFTDMGDDILVFPNPSEGKFSVKSKNMERLSIFYVTILNCLGEKMARFELKSDKPDIDISGLSNGVYFLEADIGEKRITKKLILNK
jgi:hypothetical protein